MMILMMKFMNEEPLNIFAFRMYECWIPGHDGIYDEISPASDNEMKSDNLARSLAMMEDELKRAEERVKIAEERVSHSQYLKTYMSIFGNIWEISYSKNWLVCCLVVVVCMIFGYGGHGWFVGYSWYDGLGSYGLQLLNRSSVRGE